MAYTTINNPSAHFHTQLYTGTGSLNSVTNDANAGNFKPDWLYIKNRSASWSGIVTDSTRGVNKSLFTPATDAQVTNNARGYVSAFNTDGFTVGAGSSGSDSVNTNGNNYVGWQWKANGGTTATNNAGSISSTVQANTTAGFSIVKWTSDGNNGRTVGHGLGVKPTVIITKNLSATSDWLSFFEEAGVDKYLKLNSSSAVSTSADMFGGGAQATAVFTIGQSAAGYSNGNDIIAYVFAPIQGYSKFGKYTGNGNADGPFVYTGFKPAWVMLKRSSGAADWNIFDNKRPGYNETNARLRANDSTAESTSDAGVDLLSNGFKCRLGSEFNANSTTNIYMAFAENPLVATNGVPTTAR